MRNARVLPVAISAPTGLAIRAAERAALTLVAGARDHGFEVVSQCLPHLAAGGCGLDPQPARPSNG
jgi:hypothetical protein